MKNTPLVLFLFAAFAVFGYASGAAAAGASAKRETNACGCYSLNNTCYCEKGAKCGCPGNCEPKGCEEARSKQLEKEIAEEMKKAKDAEKAQQSAKQDGKPEEDEEGDAAKKQGASGKGGKAPAPKMTATQKKQLVKLLDVYLVDHPDEKERSIIDVKTELGEK